MKASFTMLAGLLGLALGAQMPPAWAKPAAAQKYYDQGVAAMRAQDYPLALQYFHKARDAGIGSHNLHYNLGVSLFRMERYPESRESFLLAASDVNRRDLAQYNLGLIALQLDDAPEARNWFTRVALETNDVRLRDLAQDKLDGLREQRPAAEGERRWSLLADAVLGYDDNVTQTNTDVAQGSNESDRYLDLFASGKWRLSGTRDDGYWLNAKASLIQYEHVSEYDDVQAEMGIYRDAPFNAWKGRIGASVARSNLGGNDYQQAYDVSAQGSRRLSDDTRLRLRYEFSLIDSLDNRYDYLGGTRHRLGADLALRLGEHRLRLDYDLELNDRDDFRSGASFTSYSATRHGFGISGDLRLAPAWNLHLAADYRTSRYNDANVIGGVKDVTREDDRYRISGEVAHKLNGSIELTAGYRYTDNQSSIASRSYHRAQYMLGARGYF